MKYAFVDTDNGGTPANATPDTATSKYHTSSSWPANGARWSTLAGVFNDATMRGITDDLTIYCIGTAADTAAAASSSMTCAGLTIIGDLAGAAWNTGKYRLTYSGATAVALNLSGASITGAFTVRNLQIENNGTATGPAGMRLTSSVNSSTHTVDSCIVRMGNTTSATGNPIDGISVTGSAAGQTVNVYNTIVYDITGTGAAAVAYGMRFGVSSAVTVNVYNSVVQDITTGGTVARGIAANTADTVTVKNCAVYNCNDDFYQIDTVAYCASDDGDGTSPLTGLTWANEFEAPSTGDFRIKSTSTLIGAGLDDPGSGLFSDDIAGTTRTDWDIGSFEYVGAGGSLSISLVGGDNEIYSSEADFEVRGSGFSAAQTFTISGVACTELSFSSSTSVKLTAPNAISNNLKFGLREFKVRD